MPRYTHDTVPSQFVEAGGVWYAYRRFGEPNGTPLVFFQHFMGNLDDHDSALTDAFAQEREVILFNNAGVASSGGRTPDTIEQMARDAEAFIDAPGLTVIDVFAHSMGGLVGQQVAPSTVPNWCASWSWSEPRPAADRAWEPCPPRPRRSFSRRTTGRRNRPSHPLPRREPRCSSPVPRAVRQARQTLPRLRAGVGEDQPRALCGAAGAENHVNRHDDGRGDAAATSWRTT
ncbi:alpha/beta fold hydrolase [Streptomyces lydicus]|uniref:alpha/beta fold hydrolase n=1 Tax=Streptomyces lydicus TaxID=47763 RepID=UPI00343C56AC